MARESEFHLGLVQVMVRLAPLLLLIASAITEAVGSGRGDLPYEIGSRATIYDSRAERIILKTERVRVLTTSLENGRGLIAIDCRGPDADGLACLPLDYLARNENRPSGLDARCDTELLVADAWEGLSGFCLERIAIVDSGGVLTRRMRRFGDVITGGLADSDRLRMTTMTALLPRTRHACPEADCLAVEHAGVAVDSAGDVALAEAHNERVVTFQLGLRRPQPPEHAEVLGQILYSRRPGVLLHDVAQVSGAGLAVAESYVADSKLSGVRLLTAGAPDRELVSGAYAPHPVGVWFSSQTSRLYFTDVSNGVQRWMYMKRNGADWGRPQTFWTVADPGATLPRLRHIITGWSSGSDGLSREVVFASGPDGLYVIDPVGLLLAKYSLGRSLSGLDWGRSGELFFSSGRLLGVLKVANDVQPPPKAGSSAPRASIGDPVPDRPLDPSGGRPVAPPNPTVTAPSPAQAPTSVLGPALKKPAAKVAKVAERRTVVPGCSCAR